MLRCGIFIRILSNRINDNMLHAFQSNCQWTSYDTQISFQSDNGNNLMVSAQIIILEN